MTRNAENIVAVRQGMGAFLGISRGHDPQDIPPNKFWDGQNMICGPILGQVRTRDGYAPVVDTLFTSPFKIMPGAKGKLYTPPNINGGSGGGVDGGSYALTMGATPMTGLYIDDTHTEQVVTFYVYGGTALGITSYSWAFGDGQTSTGSSTSVHNHYTSPGSFTINVSGVGTDGKTYSASCSITIEKKVKIVVPPGETPTATMLVNGSTETELAAAGSATFTWTSRNAADAYLTVLNAGTVTINNKKVAANGSQSVSVTTSATASITAIATDGQEAFASALCWVREKEPPTPPGGPKALTCNLKGNGQESPKLLAPGKVTLSWTSSNALNGSIDNGVGSISPVASGSTSVQVDETTTFTLTVRDGITSATDTCTVEVGEETVAGTNLRIKITGADTAASGTAVTLSYVIEGEIASGRWTPMPSAGTVSIVATSDTVDASGGYTETLNFTTESTKDGAAHTLTLRSGQTTGTITYTATLTATDDTVGKITGATASKTITVAATTATFDVQIVDMDNADLPGPVYAVTDAGATFKLKITAKTPTLGTTDTSYARAVRVLPTLSDSGGTMNDRLAVSYTGTSSEADVIPAGSWLNGVAYVQVQVNLGCVTPTYPDFEAFQDLSFTVAEVIA